MSDKQNKYFWMLVISIIISWLLRLVLVGVKDQIDGMVFLVISNFAIGIILLRDVGPKIRGYLSDRRILSIIVFDTFLVTGIDYLMFEYTPVVGAAKTGVLSLIRIGVVYLLAIFMLKEKFDLRIFIGTLISFFGAGIILILPVLTHVHAIETADIWLILGFIMGGFAIVISKQQFQYIKPTHLVGIRSLLSSFLILPVVFTRSDFSLLGSVGWQVWAFVIGSIIIAAFASGKEFRAINRLKGEEVSSLLLLGPAVGVIGGVIFLSERMDPYSLIGSLVILAGIAISHRSNGEMMHRLQKDEEKIVRFLRNLFHKIHLKT